MARDILQTLGEKMAYPLSALEIVRDILCLKNVRPHQAELIVGNLLEGCPGFYQIDGLWIFRAEQKPFRLVFCQVFSYDRLNDFAEIWLTQYENLQAGEPIVITQSLADLSIYFNAPLFMDGLGGQMSYLRRRLPVDFLLDTPVFLLSKLLPRLLPNLSIKSAADISRALGLTFYEDAGAHLRHQAFVEQCLAVLELLHGQQIDSIDALEDFYTKDLQAVDFSKFAFDAEILRAWPDKPGVYVMKDFAGQVVYIGKSNNLRRRLRSYFVEQEPDAKLRRIRERLYDIEIRRTGSDLEALFLEQELIRALAPEINRQRRVLQRTIRLAERYSRVLILPHFDPDLATVVFFRPSSGVRQIVCPRSDGDLDHLRQLFEEIFFTEELSGGKSPEEEILVSWMAQQGADVRSIDMRAIADPMEAMRLIRDHLKSLDDPPTVHR